jgi:hypothetical protein
LVTVSTDQALNVSLAFSFVVNLGNITKGGVRLTYNVLAASYPISRHWDQTRGSGQPPLSPP